MANKDTQLSITLRAIDKATAPIRAVSERIAKLTSPLRDVAGVGMSKLVDGFKAVGGAVGSLLRSVPVLGGVIAATVGGAVFALKGMIDEFDELGDKSQAIGVDVDFLSQMRYAAEQSGASIEDLDGGLQTFTKNLGLARANAGPLVSFLAKVNPNGALLKQLKATKSNAEAVDLLADAMAKLPDSARRAALAQKALGNAALAPLFAQGRDGLRDLRAESFARTGSLKEAAERAGEADTAMKKLKAATTGVKAALVSGLAPALTVVVEKLDKWLVGHRGDIETWAKELGKKLPGAIAKIVSGIETAIEKMKTFFSAVSDLIEKADLFFNGPKELEGMTPEEFMQGKQSEVRVRNQLKGTENLSARAKLARSEQLAIEANQLIGGGEHSQRDEDIAKAKHAAAQKLRDQVGPDAAKAIRDSDFAKQIAPALEAIASFKAALVVTSARTPDLSAQARGTVADQARSIAPLSSSANAKPSENRLVVDFNNTPRGARVTADPKNTDEIDLSVGYQLLPGVL